MGTTTLILLTALIAIGAYFYLSKKQTDGQKKMILTFMGAPGSGKGTIAEKAVTDLNFKTLSTGNLLREAVASGSDLGKKAQGYMQSGQLVPDELVMSLVENWLSKNLKNIDKLILDGYPRTANQAKLLLDLIQNKFKDVNLNVVEILIPDDIVVERLTSRLVCEKCQAPYSRKNITDIEAASCEKCDGKLIQREDDKESVIRERLQVYANNAGALRNIYKVASIPIINIHVAGKEKEAIYNEFKQLLEEKNLI